ncbi:MAG TPA: LEA type 2 family protein [Nitrospiria bacterium]|nr:LEA type 2 family protein [Nitrospiria bacterium]
MPATRTGFLLAIFLLLLNDCSPGRYFSRPEVALEGVEKGKITLSGIDASVVLEVTNPNRVDVTLYRFSYRVFLADALVTEGELTDPITLPGHQTVHPRLPVHFPWEGLQGLSVALFDRSEIPYRLEGNMNLSVLGGSWTIPIHREGTVTTRPSASRR